MPKLILNQGKGKGKASNPSCRRQLYFPPSNSTIVTPGILMSTHSFFRYEPRPLFSKGYTGQGKLKEIP